MFASFSTAELANKSILLFKGLECHTKRRSVRFRREVKNYPLLLAFDVPEPSWSGCCNPAELFVRGEGGVDLISGRVVFMCVRSNLKLSMQKINYKNVPCKVVIKPYGSLNRRK